MIQAILEVADVETLHHEQIVRFGGSHGLRDRNLLESAVKRASFKAFYQPDATVAAVAASLSWGLIKNHAFIDGNKRVGLVAAVVFLKLNGYRMTVSIQEQVAEVLRVAASESSEEEWTAWVERSVAPIAG
ncbi:MAG TPA: type II toxin-antitoxin system death-on-curing family toxin [Acidobacteriaceae bacterium]